MSGDDKKKSKARLLADFAGSLRDTDDVSSAKQLHEALTANDLNSMEADISAAQTELAYVQQKLQDAEQRLFLKTRELTSQKTFILRDVEELTTEINGIEAYLEAVVPDGLWMSFDLVDDPDAAMDTQAAHDWHEALKVDEVAYKETMQAVSRIRMLYELRNEKSDEFKAIEKNEMISAAIEQDEKLVGLLQKLPEDAHAKILSILNDDVEDIKQTVEVKRDDLRRLRDRRNRAAHGLPPHPIDDSDPKFARKLPSTVRASADEGVTNDAEDVPTAKENDRILAEMEERFAIQQAKSEQEREETRSQLDRIENILSSVMQEFHASQEENVRLKAQIAEQNNEPPEPPVKEASAKVEVSFGVSAKAEVGKASVNVTSRHASTFDMEANRDYWKDPRRRNTEWRIPFAERHWKVRQAIMIRSGVDLFETPVLKVRLMSYFRQNVWNCEILNVGNGDTAYLGLGHGKFSTPASDGPFVMTCLDRDNAWKAVEDEVMDELGLDKYQRLQKHECFEVRREVLRRLGRAA